MSELKKRESMDYRVDEKERLLEIIKTKHCITKTK